MEDQSYYIYTARKITETESILRKDQKPPKKLIKKIQESSPEEIARFIWENKHLIKEGTRAFVQPRDILDRSTKPTTHFSSKTQSQYPNAPDESPKSKNAPFPERSEYGAQNPEPLLHEEEWPLSHTRENGGFPTPGYTGQASDPIGSNIAMQPSSAQHGMEAEPDVFNQPPSQDNDASSILSDSPMGDPNDTGLPPTGDHVCPICKMGFDGDDALVQHMGQEHSQIFNQQQPMGQEAGIPSAVYPYER